MSGPGLRIALVLGASTGGIGRHVAGLARRLVADGHQVQVFCPPSTSVHHGLDELGLVVRSPALLPRARGADVVHAHGYKAIGQAAVLLGTRRPGRPPLIGSWHNAVLADGPAGVLGRRLQRISARSADLTLGASSDLAALARTLGAPAVELVPVAAPTAASPVDTRPASPVERRALIRDQLDVGDSQVVLSIGRLAAQKNYPMLLDVARSWRDRPGVRFLVVGDGPERTGLEQRIRSERLPVDLLGSRADVWSLLGVADAFLLTSHWEARALVVQEAMLAGVPVVATDVGGIAELTGEAAVLVPAGDVRAAATALGSILESPATAERLRSAGRAQAAGWPDEDEVARALEAIYRREIARARHSTRPRFRT